MRRISQHKILLAGDSYDHCCDQADRFFALTTLVIYDCIEARDTESVSGLDADFFTAVHRAIDRNKKTVQDLVSELRKNGIRSSDDLAAVDQGYVSKTLHILSHFLDGFIGIDSYFYNMLDDSHWLPAATAGNIRRYPQKYWLVHIDCYSATPEEAGILRL